MICRTEEGSVCEDWGSPLHRAVGNGDVDQVRSLIDSGAGCLMNEFDSEGRTPLMLAVARGRLDLVKLLIDAGADVNACDVDNDGVPALAIAAASQSIEMVALLLSAGADPLEPGVVERTAYHAAERRSDDLTIPILRLFLKRDGLEC